ncbi:MAG: hypothetical protein JSW11_13725 [Candidatus Heimdallarchaeota archaeon]|nr:MAG: hypothetical protein JSW11_13725 [Candidatus Heimdallarchaeota archaeon]
MPRNDTKKGTSATEGLIITIFEDYGPQNIYNSSPLSEEEAFNLAIKSLTALSSDIPQFGEIRSYGPIPTPRDPFLTIGFIFSLKAVDSEDVRITQFGRIVVFWVITRSSSTVKYVGVLKQLLRRTIRSYKIRTDIDLNNKEVLKKIDEKLQIIETGIESFYLTDRGTFEPFLELALLPTNAPIMLVDNPNKQINVLLREEVTPSLKLNMLHLTKNFAGKLPKGSLYKVEIISDELTVQRMLSKIGLISQTETGFQYRIRFTSQLSYDEVDECLNSLFTQKRQSLAKLIVLSYEKKSPLNLEEAAVQTGICEAMVKDLIFGLIDVGLVKNGKIENGFLSFNK